MWFSLFVALLLSWCGALLFQPIRSERSLPNNVSWWPEAAAFYKSQMPQNNARHLHCMTDCLRKWLKVDPTYKYVPPSAVVTTIYLCLISKSCITTLGLKEPWRKTAGTSCQETYNASGSPCIAEFEFFLQLPDPNINVARKGD